MIIVRMTSGAMIAFPPDIMQGLRGAIPSHLADVTIHAAGTVLHWEVLDVQFELTALLTGLFGTRAWMRELGRRGGRVTSEAKARAARENGRRGGRPRKP